MGIIWVHVYKWAHTHTHTHTHTQRTHNGTNQITLNKFQPLGIYSPPTSHGVMGLHTSSAAT